MICLVLAYVLAELCRRVGVPKAVGQITAGLILGAGAWRLDLFSPENGDILSFLANLGIILLFYYVGLETNFSVFTKNINRSALISLFNTLIPFALGFSFMHWWFDADFLVSIIVGVSLSVSAQSISLSLLEEMKLLKSKVGTLIIAAGAVDDILELVMTTVLLSLFHVAIAKLTLSRFLLDVSLFVLAIVLCRVWFIPILLKFFDREKSSTNRFMGSLIILLMIASLSEFLGVGLLIGAMIAGMMIRQTVLKDVTIPHWEEHEIARSIHMVAFGFLIPLFFVWTGVAVDLQQVVSQAGFILIITVIATVGTVGGTVLAVLLNKGSFREGLLLGWGLNPKGDIELVIATLALHAGLITSVIFTSLVIMSLVTMIISPVVFKLLARKVYHSRKFIG
ncbi:TPA: cation:proton antiporter [Candidatus Woesearchaeota archaeon]|nr:cation:proton antiporter [Candidatus Woesearchaeota archaeon]